MEGVSFVVTNIRFSVDGLSYVRPLRPTDVTAFFFPFFSTLNIRFARNLWSKVEGTSTVPQEFFYLTTSKMSLDSGAATGRTRLKILN